MDSDKTNMKIMQKFTLFFSLIALTICLYVSVKNVKVAKKLAKENMELKGSIEEAQRKILSNKKSQNYNLFSENKKIGNIPLISMNGRDTIDLVNVINKTKLVYRFYNGTCVQCVEDELDIVKSLEDSIGHTNIVIISNSKAVELKAIIERKKIASSGYIYQDKFNLPIENEPNEVASFFLLKPNLITDFVYKAGGIQDITMPYYSRIIEYFIEEKLKN